MNKKMILTEKIPATLDYIKESVEEKNPNLLGRLKGVCADWKNPTRNGRKYTKELWENVVKSDTFKEYLETKTLYGELNHPADRLETDIKEIAIALSDIDFNSDGTLIGTFDILNTPNGRILKTLCDYGSKLGVSSRGGGEVITRNGETFVDEDSYEFMAFDVVTLPAVAAARPAVIESKELEKKAKPLKESIITEIENASTKGEILSIKRIVENISLPGKDSILETLENKLGNLEGESFPSKLLDDLNDTIQALEEQKKEKAQLLKNISAGTFREKELKEELEKVRGAARVLGEKAKKLPVLEKMLEKREHGVAKLTEQKLISLENERSKEKIKYEVLKESHQLLLKEKTNLSRTLGETEEEVTNLKERVASLQEAFNKSSNELVEKADAYRTQLASIKKDLKLKTESLNKEITESNDLTRKYAKEFKTLSDAFIKMQCKYEGLDESIVRARLNNTYTTGDLERAINESMDYKNRIEVLPFQVTPSKMNVQFIESKTNLTPKNKQTKQDDFDLERLGRMLENINK